MNIEIPVLLDEKRYIDRKNQKKQSDLLCRTYNLSAIIIRRNFNEK